MKEGEVVVSIIVPIVIGPLFIFFKSLWDRYNIKKEEIKKIEYDENITRIREQLNLFYWPLLIKLKCLNHLNYSESTNENVELQEIFLNDSMSETNDTKFLKNNKRKKRKKGKICGNNIMINGEFVLCNGVVHNPDIFTYCQKCELKKGKKAMSDFSDSDLDNVIKKRKSILQTDITIDIEEELEWEDMRRTTIKKKKTEENIKLSVESPKRIKIDVVDETSGTSSSSKKSSESNVSRNIPHEDKLNKKTIHIEKLLKHELDHKIIFLAMEIKKIIENSISIIKPNRKLGKELVRFIRFVETMSIIDSYNHKKKENNNKYKNYTYGDLGVINNTKKLIRIIYGNLNLLLDEEQKVKDEYLNIYSISE
jgi:hypothetical protein